MFAHLAVVEVIVTPCFKISLRARRQAGFWENWWEKTVSSLSICPEALIGSVQLQNDPSDTK